MVGGLAVLRSAFRRSGPARAPGVPGLPALALALVAMLALAAGARAQELDEIGDSGFDLTARSVEYDRLRELYVARGDVHITQPDRSLTADWAAFSNATGRGLATGNVVLRQGGDTLHAEVLQFEVDSQLGVVLQGRLDARGSQFEMTGEEVRKTGPDTYEFEEGTFTTCRCPEEERQPWQIRAEEAELEVGGYGTARNTTFEVLGVPVLWLPWMIYPLRTDRQSGFLLPILGGGSRRGTEVGLPYFWAARPNLNVTFTPSYLSERGFKPSVELEYVFGERSWGELYATYIHDQDIDSDDPSTPFSPDRWAAEWIHEQFLPADWRLVVDARAFSDNLYSFDFGEFSETREDRFLESTAFVERRFGALQRSSAVASLWYSDDLQNPDDQDRDRFLLQRLPHLSLASVPAPVGVLQDRIAAAFDVDYSFFTQRRRAERVYSDSPVVGDDLFLDTGIDAIPNGEERNLAGMKVPGDAHGDDGIFEGDGRFQEGEPLADRGHRLLLNPRVGIPFRLFDAVEVFPEMAWHGTVYQTRAQSAELRSMFTGQLDMRSRLRRGLRLPFGLGQATHLLEPRLAYTVVSKDHQDSNPLFVPRTAVPQQRLRQLDLFNVTRDPADRVESFSAVTAGLGNRLYVSGEEGAPPRLLADVQLSAQYEISNDDLQALFMDGTLYPSLNIRTRFNLGYDLRDSRVSEGLVSFGWSSESGHDLAIHYRYLRDIPNFFESFAYDDERFDEFEDNFLEVNQLTLYGRMALTRNWALSYTGQYSFENSLFLTNQAGVEYISRCACWALRLEVEDDRARGLEFGIRYTLIGLGDDSVRPFGGGRRSSRSPEPETEPEG